MPSLDPQDWADAEIADLVCVRPESGQPAPTARARLLVDDAWIHGLFEVRGERVRCLHRPFGGAVCKDSCVEFFVEPQPGRGYFNFEFNAIGSWMVCHITDPDRSGPAKFRAYLTFAESDAPGVRIVSSVPGPVDPPAEAPLDWQLAFAIPLDWLARESGAPLPRPGARWRANLYKCGDETPIPHWLSWSPVDALNFHLPHCFGDLVFA